MILVSVLSVACVVLIAFVAYEKRAYASLAEAWADEKRQRLESERQRDLALGIAQHNERIRMESEDDKGKAENDLTRVREGLEANARLLTAQSRVNDALVREKEELWGLYQSTTAQLGNAQSMILQEYSQLLRSYNAYRRSHGDAECGVNPVLEQVLPQEGDRA
jgi:ribosomal protein L3